LILRFFDVTEGKILVDGVDVKEWDIISLRKAMGLVMQEPTLFNYTISENILYGKSDAKNSQIRGATQIANAAEFIESAEIENSFDESADALLKELQRNQAYLEHKYGPEKMQEIKDDLVKL
jgi:ATP-binding cassette, subfamily B, multidrug efflux pump